MSETKNVLEKEYQYHEINGHKDILKVFSCDGYNIYLTDFNFKHKNNNYQIQISDKGHYGTEWFRITIEDVSYVSNNVWRNNIFNASSPDKILNDSASERKTLIDTDKILNELVSERKTTIDTNKILNNSASERKTLIDTDKISNPIIGTNIYPINISDVTSTDKVLDNLNSISEKERKRIMDYYLEKIHNKENQQTKYQIFWNDKIILVSIFDKYYRYGIHIFKSKSLNEYYLIATNIDLSEIHHIFDKELNIKSQDLSNIVNKLFFKLKSEINSNALFEFPLSTNIASKYIFLQLLKDKYQIENFTKEELSEEYDTEMHGHFDIISLKQ